MGSSPLGPPRIGTVQLAGSQSGNWPEGDRVLVAGAAVADGPLTFLIVLRVHLVGIPAGYEKVTGRRADRISVFRGEAERAVDRSCGTGIRLIALEERLRSEIRAGCLDGVELHEQVVED